MSESERTEEPRKPRTWTLLRWSYANSYHLAKGPRFTGHVRVIELEPVLHLLEHALRSGAGLEAWRLELTNLLREHGRLA